MAQDVMEPAVPQQGVRLTMGDDGRGAAESYEPVGMGGLGFPHRGPQLVGRDVRGEGEERQVLGLVHGQWHPRIRKAAVSWSMGSGLLSMTGSAIASAARISTRSSVTPRSRRR